MRQRENSDGREQRDQTAKTGYGGEEVVPHLEPENHLHPVPTQRADVIEDKGGDDVNTVALVSNYTGLREGERERNQAQGCFKVFFRSPLVF